MNAQEAINAFNSMTNMHSFTDPSEMCFIPRQQSAHAFYFIDKVLIFQHLICYLLPHGNDLFCRVGIWYSQAEPLNVMHICEANEKGDNVIMFWGHSGSLDSENCWRHILSSH